MVLNAGWDMACMEHMPLFMWLECTQCIAFKEAPAPAYTAYARVSVCVQPLE